VTITTHTVSRIERGLAQGVATITGSALGPYQSAVIRIGFSLTWLLFLLREWPHRQELYGPGGPWSWDMARRLVGDNGAFTVLLWSDSRLWADFVYVFALVASVLLLLGWRTRTMSVFFMVGVLSLQNRSIFVGDGGDNVIHLMAIYLVLTRCGQVWSLDARRRGRQPEQGSHRDILGAWLWGATGTGLAVVALLNKVSWGWALVFFGLWIAQALWWFAERHAPGEPRAVLDMLANLAHNGVLAVIMAEVCLIYATAGWYKIQGSRWQDGTAVYYPLHLDYFGPWPALSELLGGNGLLVMLITYGTVIVQVAFPFTLFNRRVKNVLLAFMMTEHLAISVTLGLPFFSLAMISADAVFLPTGFLRWAGGRVTRLRDRLFARTAREPAEGTDREPDRTLVG
jgi:hypothetical protein